MAILAVLMSLLFPSMKNLLYNGDMTICRANLRNVGMGMFLYVEDFNDLYPKATSTHSSSLGQTVNDRTSTNAITQLNWRSNMYDIILPYYTGGSENVANYSTTERSFEDAFMCPQVDNSELWPVHHNRKRAPGYYTNVMPYQLYWDIRGHGHTAVKMERLGDSWSWRNWNYSTGPTGANLLDYEVLASDVLHRIAGKYGTGSSGTRIITNHIKPGAEGEMSIWWGSWGPYGRAWRVEPETTLYDSNYLLQDGSVVYQDSIPYNPDESSEVVRFGRSYYVPAELGN